MKKNLLCFVILMSACSSQIFAQCQANFSWTQTANNIITFTDLSTGLPANTNFAWNFGDNQGNYAQNPVHTFNIPGTYNVCLNITDSMAATCNSTFCASVTVTGVVICNITLSMTATMASCSTCTDGVANAYPSGGTAPYTYLWQPGNITTPSITGIATGTYTCCVTDANACTACNSVNVLASTCQAGFTWLQTANNVITFTNTSTGVPPSGYNWNFGNSQFGNTQNPVHFYTTPGTYNVCLTLFDSSVACSSTFCSVITVTGLNCNNIALTVAAANASCPSCNDGSATATASGGTPPYSYLWSTSATTPAVSNLLTGYYTCSITDAIGCTASAGAFVDSSAGCSASFTVAPAGPPQTYNAVNLATGTPPLAYVWSWGDNTYSYTAFPTHTYASAGFYTICLGITDALGCQSMHCDSFYLARLENYSALITVIVVASPTGINNSAFENSWSVFPNPFSEQAVISFSQELSDATLRLYNLYGQLVQEKNNINGKEIILTCENLSSGVYVYEVTDKEKKICAGKAVVY